jgi:hypothetical protein
VVQDRRLSAVYVGVAHVRCGVQVVLTGGCINVPGFVPRFQTELRALVPSELELVVTAPVVSPSSCRLWCPDSGNMGVVARLALQLLCLCIRVLPLCISLAGGWSQAAVLSFANV